MVADKAKMLLTQTFNSVTGGDCIPQVVGTITSLTSLDLSHNQIVTINPAIFGSLQSLEGLSLSCNALTNVPNEISLLTNLKVLNLSDNPNLRWLPDTLFKLSSSMEELYIRCAIVVYTRIASRTKFISTETVG